ncbi:hypothetical protein [Methylorubrum extorquens]|uniref:Uncharacterized protein n=1 Tax=Methylorubrum extorquens (strain CM4 / NCIMB 13688) TaxID=440085 RepID=B7KTI0_METC4|nr:hypothetical protein [Methylorubrum extorquens]ACK82507.1 hypothetical protein Mchl_1643 [Methylorubrum extorquens CM4]
MAEATKSLAAEIEAVMRKHIKCDATGLAPAVASVFLQGIPEAAAEIAALQGRTFEDGARWMRERAKQACETEREVSRNMAAVYSDGGRLYDELCGQADALGAIAATIAALPLQPEGESDA